MSIIREIENGIKKVNLNDLAIAEQLLEEAKKENSIKVFVYGTLMHGQANHYYMKDAVVIGDAVVRGYELYDTGRGYPAVKNGANSSVSGELYIVSSSKLEDIDYLESNGVLYSREFTIAEDVNGEKHLALIYVYNYEVSDDMKIPYWKKLNDEDYVWYASYGSNLNYKRFMRYINECYDKTPPIESKALIINHRLYFAKYTFIWDGAPAFIDPQKNMDEITLGRMYLIKKDQFEEVQLYEGSNYTNKIILGKFNNIEIITFTDIHVVEEAQPSLRYLNVIKEGISEIYPNLTESEIEQYLQERIASCYDAD